MTAESDKTAAVAAAAATADAKTARRNLTLLDDLRVELDMRERTFLRSRGWLYTSQTPGFRWMWSRMLHGVQIMAGQADALEHERAILRGDAPAKLGHKALGK